MLADIVVRSSFLVRIVSKVSGTRHILFIFSPADTFSFQQINYCLDRCIDCPSAIRCETISAASSGCNVVWLTGVGNGLVVGQRNALACNPLKIGCVSILTFPFPVT